MPIFVADLTVALMDSEMNVFSVFPLVNYIIFNFFTFLFIIDVCLSL